MKLPLIYTLLGAKIEVTNQALLKYIFASIAISTLIIGCLIVFNTLMLHTQIKSGNNLLVKQMQICQSTQYNHNRNFTHYLMDGNLPNSVKDKLALLEKYKNRYGELKK